MPAQIGASTIKGKSFYEVRSLQFIAFVSIHLLATVSSGFDNMKTYTLTVYYCGKEKTVVQGVKQEDLEGLADILVQDKVLSLHGTEGFSVYVPTRNVDYYTLEVEAQEEEEST